MAAPAPDYDAANLVLRLYELRRDPVMRQSRDAMGTKFWPKSYEEFVSVTKLDHHMNAAWRQTTSYWEMVYGFAKHGIIDPDFLVESNGEGIFVYAKLASYIPRFREEVAPTAFQNTEWIIANSKAAKQKFEILQKRVAVLAPK